MTKSIIKVAFWGLLSIVLLAVAIPTFTVKLGEDYYRIRNLSPSDFFPEFLVQEYAFAPSIELQGGSIGTVEVDMDNIGESDQLTNFQINRNNFVYRLNVFQNFLKRGFKTLNYDLQEAISTDNSEYKLLVKFPGFIDKDRLSIFTTPGSVSVWVDDSLNADPNMTEEEKAAKPYGLRRISNITNEDIASVNVVTDSSCYYDKPESPRNFCVRMTFKASAQSKFNEGFLANPTGNYPAILFVDQAPVAVKSTGQVLDTVNPGLTIDWYLLIDDDYETTAILASVLNDRPLGDNVLLNDFNSLEATAGVETLKYIEIALISTFLVVNVLLLVYFKKRGWLAVILNILFAIFAVAIMKIFGLVLDTALILGGLVSFLAFLSFVTYMLYQVRTAASGGISEDEIEELYQNTKKHFTYLTITTCILAFIMSNFAPAFMLSMFIGFGFGIIAGYLVLSFPGVHLLKILFLKSLAWKIW